MTWPHMTDLFKAYAGKKPALARLGILGHAPSLSAKIIIEPATQKLVDKEILRANGNKMKDLEAQLRLKKNIVVDKLKMKYKT
eukprot:8576850-Karenia_brevis.AAC.1